MRLTNATQRKLKNIPAASFVNSEDIWGRADLLIFLLTEPSIGLGIVHFTLSGTNILLQFSWRHLTLPHSCLGFSDPWPGTSVEATQNLCKPGSVRGAILDQPGMAAGNCLSHVSFKCAYLRCILHGFQTVPEGSGPSSPRLWANWSQALYLLTYPVSLWLPSQSPTPVPWDHFPK